MLYKCVVSYDGTRYHGWQMQEKKIPTVASALCGAFKKAFGCEVGIVGASRTDAGVHAYGQVMRCRTSFDIEPADLATVWNRVLPSDILIRHCERVNEQFHPQCNVAEKTYWYHIFERRPLPFYAPYGYCSSHVIRHDVLEACVQLCVGTHDFRSFCTGEYDTTVRTITGIRVVPLPRFHALRVEVRGPTFLYLMVRRIVGSAVYVASRKQLSVQTFHDIFAAGNPLHQLPTAPAQGLLLRKILYTTTF